MRNYMTKSKTSPPSSPVGIHLTSDENDHFRSVKHQIILCALIHAITLVRHACLYFAWQPRGVERVIESMILVFPSFFMEESRNLHICFEMALIKNAVVQNLIFFHEQRLCFFVGCVFEFPNEFTSLQTCTHHRVKYFSNKLVSLLHETSPKLRESTLRTLHCYRVISLRCRILNDGLKLKYKSNSV